MSSFEQKLSEYARLLVRVGVNIQKGQKLVISCPVDYAAFARLCVAEAYEAGCAEVIMNWTDDNIMRQRYLNGDDRLFDEFPEWRVRFHTDYAKEGAATLNLNASDPMALAGVDPSRLSRAQRAQLEPMKEYRDLMFKNTNQWSIGCMASPVWAKLVHPELPEAQAVEKLWEEIFKSVRVDGTGSAVKAWEEHGRNLTRRVEILNEYNFDRLIYKNSLGTDFSCKLLENHLWAGGGCNTTGGVFFVPNMPTEEIFSAPATDGSNGVLCASIPLCYNGNLISDIRMEIENGRIVKATASENESILTDTLNMDEGARHFGEVALIPYDSPISNMKALFYKTLFDENASCHFAFGKAYPECLKGGENMSLEEIKAAGMNDSTVHVDFMVGTSDLSITGITHDGREIPVFVNGNFAF